jgi:Kelch motif
MRAILFLLLCTSISISAQTQYWQDLTPMPEAVTNNAVVAARVGTEPFVYSLCGIDSTKKYNGIHLKAWRYGTLSQKWEQIPSVPDPKGGKIATSASMVKGKIYLIGGYHVAANGDEVSSKKVHRFDPVTNSWLSDGADIPVAIDDQVQCVWRDSLIYVVTGWSNTTNVANVQIYNPTTDTWSVGTPVPNNNSYKAFGASGCMYGNTIMYIGGASTGANFPAVSKLRRGVINPDNPTQITWSEETNPLGKAYRSACVLHEGHPTWLGGSQLTYNYDGIAYNGSGGVAATDRMVGWNIDSNRLELGLGNIPFFMDVRSVANLEWDNSVYVAGGMREGQQVTNRFFVLNWVYLVDTENPEVVDNEFVVLVSPNPASEYIMLQNISDLVRVDIFDQNGKLALSVKAPSSGVVEVGNLPKAVYQILQYRKVGVVLKGSFVKQ